MNTGEDYLVLFANEGPMLFEINFIVKKFMELPEKEKEEIYYQMKCSQSEKQFEAAKVLIKLITDNTVEMAKSVDSAFDTWIIFEETVFGKLRYIIAYFRTHLKLMPDETFSIQPLPAK